MLSASRIAKSLQTLSRCKNGQFKQVLKVLESETPAVRTSTNCAAITVRLEKTSTRGYGGVNKGQFTSSSKTTLLRRSFASNNLPTHELVTLPNLSPTMESGRIVSWEKEEGDFLGEGEVLAMIETDKATMEMETPEEGYLAKIIMPGGSKDIPVNQLICIIVSDEGDVAAFKDYVASDAAAPTASAPPPTKAPPTPPPAVHTAVPVAPPAAPPVAPTGGGGRIFASPIAKRIAAEKGIDLASVSGTGPRGRITQEDVESAQSVPAAAPLAPQAAAQSFQVPISTAAPALPQEPRLAYTDITLTNMRKVIAKRLVESKQTVPHYYLSVDVNMDKVMSLRSELNSSAEGFKLSVNDFVIKASAMSLKKVPQCNSQWMHEFIREFQNVDISVAVSTDGGLITPIVVDADKKGLSVINQDVANLAAKARSNKLRPQEFQGGTFTISNLGMYGITNFSAVINPPQSCILAVGGTAKKIVPDESLDIGYKSSSVMSVTLSCDHRVVDGAVGAQWLKVFRDYLENPLTMML